MNALAKTVSLFLYLSNLREELLPALFQAVDTGGRAVQKHNLARRPLVGPEAEGVHWNGVLETMVRRPEPITSLLPRPNLRTADLLATPTRQCRRCNEKS